MHNPYQSQLDALTQQISETELLLSDPEFKNLAESELASLTEQRQQLEQAASSYAQSLEQTETAVSAKVNCTIEIRPGAGGDEAKIWANDLLRMYLRFAERLGLKNELIDDLVVKIKGKARITHPKTGDEIICTAYELFEYESGVHRVQRVPATEAQGRIHTSTASVAVLPEIPASEISIREEDLEWSFMRSSGAGGQSVNKTNSAVRLVHSPSGIVVNARQERKQTQNRQIALELLRSLLWEIEEEKRQAELGTARSAIGRARRAEKIRTYNYPQNRITDHRTKQSWHNLPVMLDGVIEEMVLELKDAIENGSGESTANDAETETTNAQ